jgi:hypothetical protein
MMERAVALASSTTIGLDDLPPGKAVSRPARRAALAHLPPAGAARLRARRLERRLMVRRSAHRRARKAAAKLWESPFAPCATGWKSTPSISLGTTTPTTLIRLGRGHTNDTDVGAKADKSGFRRDENCRTRPDGWHFTTSHPRCRPDTGGSANLSNEQEFEGCPSPGKVARAAHALALHDLEPNTWVYPNERVYPHRADDGGGHRGRPRDDRARRLPQIHPVVEWQERSIWSARSLRQESYRAETMGYLNVTGASHYYPSAPGATFKTG